jgi:DNA-binding NarL/FixJ family response regulator
MSVARRGTATLSALGTGNARQAAGRQVRVVIADEAPIIHLAFRAMLAAMQGFVLAAAAGNLVEAEQLVLRTQPELLLCETDLAGEDGISLCRWTCRASPRTSVVMLSGRDDPRLAMSAMAAGASGYLLKASPQEALMTYLRQIAAGRRVVDERLGQSRQAAAEPDRVAEFGLSPREREVLNEILIGLGNQAISRRLCISEDTVKSHVKSIFRKLGAHDRAHAVALALGTAQLRGAELWPAQAAVGRVLPQPRLAGHAELDRRAAVVSVGPRQPGPGTALQG